MINAEVKVQKALEPYSDTELAKELIRRGWYKSIIDGPTGTTIGEYFTVLTDNPFKPVRRKGNENNNISV